MKKQKLILLNGFAASGKTTIAEKYISENPLSMSIEGDSVMDMIGCWRQNEIEARKIKLDQIESMIKTHLKSGYDVILPYLITDSSHVDIFRDIAEKFDVEFYDIFLYTDKKTSVKRLLKRGVWGEKGSKKLTEDDRPRIESLYNLMITELDKRNDVLKIQVKEDDIGGTWNQVVSLF
jgi:predicted kinase